MSKLSFSDKLNVFFEVSKSSNLFLIIFIILIILGIILMTTNKKNDSRNKIIYLSTCIFIVVFLFVAFLFPFIVIYLRTFKCHRDEISGRIIFTPLTKPFSLQACAIGLTGERNYSAIAIIGVKCLFRINPFPFIFLAVFNFFNEQARFVIGENGLHLSCHVDTGNDAVKTLCVVFLVLCMERQGKKHKE